MRIRRRRDDTEAAAPPPEVAPRGAGDHVGESRGGYRLVRLLGVGRRASVYLGHADAAPGQEHETVAVKIFHPGVPEASIDAEIEALSRCAHPHIVLLHDVAAEPDGRPCLVLERLVGGSLSRLVSDRERIGPGEAVTILAPLLAAVEAMHASGVAHGGLRLSSVLFRASGAPVIAGFGSAAPMPGHQSEAALALDPLVGRDRGDLVAVSRAVLARVPGEAAASLADALPDSVEAIDPALVFALADPAPVRLLAAGAESESVAAVAGVAARAIAPRNEPEQRPGAAHRARGGYRGSAERIRHLLVDQARQVRPRFWVTGAAVAVSVVAAVLLVPQGDTGGPEPGAASAVGGPTPAADADTQPAPPEDPLLSAPPDDPVLSDDPVAAAGALLAERERCLRDLSVLCLDGVLQNGSAAMERDAAIIRSIQGGGEVPAEAVIAVGELILVERLGDTALVSLGLPDTGNDGGALQGDAAGNRKPASTLVMRGEAGWRIRDYQ